MGGVNIDENILIDKTVHKAIDSRSAVLKVCRLPGISFGLPCPFYPHKRFLFCNDIK
jgi:hypothetical protein